MTRKLTPAEIEDQRRGSTRIAPGLWRDRHGHLHVSIPELLALVELEDTPANRAEVERIAREAWSRNVPGAIIVRQDPD